MLQGFQPEQISIYTDDERLGRASFILHPENYVAPDVVAALKNRVKAACRRFGESAYENVLRCLTRSIVSKVNGSEFTLYHYRAHYLANAGRKSVELLSSEPAPAVQGYDEWISSVAFRFYMSSRKATALGILGPFQPEYATDNGAVPWDFVPPFSR